MLSSSGKGTSVGTGRARTAALRPVARLCGRFRHKRAVRWCRATASLTPRFLAHLGLLSIPLPFVRRLGRVQRESLEAQEGARDERGTSTGGYAQGRVRADVGRETRSARVGGQRPPLRGLGDL